MDKEKLQQRMADLQARQEQLLADINAVNGAIQECQYWLSQIERAEVPVAPEITE